jgi:four helix bundle protein
MKSYTDLDVWKKSRLLVKDVYLLTKDFPRDEIFGLSSQMKRCAVSVPSNIAEGHGRNHAKDTLQFFYISRGSLYELETQLFLSLDLEFIKKESFDTNFETITHCKQMINGLIRYYKTLL